MPHQLVQREAQVLATDPELGQLLCERVQRARLVEGDPDHGCGAEEILSSGTPEHGDHAVVELTPQGSTRSAEGGHVQQSRMAATDPNIRAGTLHT